MAYYFGIAFLKSPHGVAADWGQAEALALAAGVDVERPTVKTFGQPLRDAVAAGEPAQALVDRALRRVLTQKAQLGLLEPGSTPAGARRNRRRRAPISTRRTGCATP